MTDTTKGPLLGREVGVRTLDEAQLGLLAHQAKIMQRESSTKDENVRALAMAFRIIFSAFPTPDDREFVEDSVADGKVTAAELIRFITDTAAGGDAKALVAKAPVRRGRPRKAA